MEETLASRMYFIQTLIDDGICTPAAALELLDLPIINIEIEMGESHVLAGIHCG